MTDLLVLPPPKRTRSRRLRKKLRIGEFQTLGFDYELTWQAPPSIELQDRFIDQLLRIAWGISTATRALDFRSRKNRVAPYDRCSWPKSNTVST